MYELFEFVKLLSVKGSATQRSHGKVTIRRFAWKEEGEISFLAMLCSNGQQSRTVFKDQHTYCLGFKREKSEAMLRTFISYTVNYSSFIAFFFFCMNDGGKKGWTKKSMTPIT